MSEDSLHEVVDTFSIYGKEFQIKLLSVIITDYNFYCGISDWIH